jgi:hypothetical protein
VLGLVFFPRSKIKPWEWWHMRIFVQPPNPGDSLDGLVLRACDVLRQSLVFSARPRGIIDDCAVVLIEPLELADAMTALRKAGMRASSD